MSRFGEMARSALSAERGTVIVGSALLALGLVAAGLAVGDGLVRMRRADREVTVRGVAQRAVTADKASWHIGYSASDFALKDALAHVDTSSGKVGAYLHAHGFNGSATAPGSAEVSVRDERVDDKPTGRQVYTVTRKIAFTTTDVAGVQKLQAERDRLVQDGLVPDDVGASYEFTGLDRIKPEMIAEATKDARRAAEKFASDSGAGVGGIRSATQGYFSVSSASAASGDDESEGGGSRTAASPDQSVRVVTTINYYLD